MVGEAGTGAGGIGAAGAPGCCVHTKPIATTSTAILTIHIRRARADSLERSLETAASAAGGVRPRARLFFFLLNG